MRSLTTYPKRGAFNYRTVDFGWITFQDRLCKTCGAIVPPEDKECRHCGRRAVLAQAKREEREAQKARGYSVALSQLTKGV